MQMFFYFFYFKYLREEKNPLIQPMKTNTNIS
jgi:hypothetical protein